MSHDIRTPMNAIISFLAGDHIDNEAGAGLPEKISTSSRTSFLINDVLISSRIESERKIEKNVHLPDFQRYAPIIQPSASPVAHHHGRGGRDCHDCLAAECRAAEHPFNAIRFTPATAAWCIACIVCARALWHSRVPRATTAYQFKHIFEDFRKPTVSGSSRHPGLGLHHQEYRRLMMAPSP